MFILTLAFPTNVNAKVKLNKKSITITKGKTYTLKINGTKKKAKWSSSKKSIVSVSKSGKVKGKKRGSSTITAKIGKKTYKCKVKVETPSLSATKKSIAVGKKYTLKLNNCSRSKKFTSSNNSVATVSKSGVITAKKTGNSRISVKISDKTYYCSISVYQPSAPKPQNPVGSRTNPANPRNGITVTEWSGGTMYFKLLDTIKGTNAINQLRAMGEWGSYEENYELPDHTNDTLVLFVYDVKAISGYSERPLQGLDIINSYDLYDGSCSRAINDIEACYMSENYEAQDNANLKLFNGTSSKMYMALWIPNGMTSFSNTVTVKGFNDYWVKYTF